MSVEREQIGDCTLYRGDALTVMQALPSASVNLLVVDPPYYKVKLDYTGQRIDWDRQWKTFDAYLAWLDSLAQEWQRLLAPNGSLYCFAAPQYAAQVEVMLAARFTVLNHLVWRKQDVAGNGTYSKACKEELRSFFPQTERILFCEQPYADSMALGASGYAAQCEQLRGFVFEPIRLYLEGERQRAGIPREDCNTACGVSSIAGGHYFSRSQWCLPTAEHYASLQRWFNAHGRRPAPAFKDYHPDGSPFARWHQLSDEALRTDYEYLRTDYEVLRTDYEALRTDYEALRRPFAVSPHVPFTDVWDFPTVSATPGKHPCEKPLALLRHMIETSSRPGDMVLDCCAGSCSTLDAARQCGRKSIGIEQDPHWYAKGKQRLSQETLFTMGTLLSAPMPTPVAQQLPLLAKESPLDTNAGIV